MKKTYYILAFKYPGQGYAVDFGAYDKEDVIEEQKTYYNYKGCTKVITTIDDQRTIDSAINKLNKKG